MVVKKDFKGEKRKQRDKMSLEESDDDCSDKSASASSASEDSESEETTSGSNSSATTESTSESTTDLEDKLRSKGSSESGNSGRKQSQSSQSQPPSIPISESGHSPTHPLKIKTKSSVRGNRRVGSSVKDALKKPRRRRRKPRALTICLTNCRYEIVRNVAKRYSLVEVGEDEAWNIYWTDFSVSLERAMDMRRYQLVNHFPGMNEICRKDLLARNLNRMKRLFHADYDIFPKTWSLPADLGELQSYAHTRKNKTYICKPEMGCQGRGIFLIRSIKDLNPFGKIICQLYIARPFLIDNLKFDLRIYVLMTTCDPLRIYVYHEGLARFATAKYKPPTNSNTENSYMHLTNYAVNKYSRDFVVDDEGGSKRKLTAVYRWLEQRSYDTEELLNSIDDVIIKTIISAHPILKHNYRTCFPNHDLCSACFEILGFDILLDYKLKPYVLEVNHSPSFHTDAKLDKEIKESLLNDTFAMLNMKQLDIYKVESDDRRRVQERLLNINRNQDKKEKNELIDGMSIADQQFQWELEHCGGYRLVFPSPTSEKYDKYFDQNLSSLYHETAASQARANCTRTQMEEYNKLKQQEERKRLALGNVGPGSMGLDRERPKDKLRPESPADPDKPKIRKKVFKKPREGCGFSPNVIIADEELDRMKSLMQRGMLIRSLGIELQVFKLLCQIGNLKPEEEKIFRRMHGFGNNGVSVAPVHTTGPAGNLMQPFHRFSGSNPPMTKDGRPTEILEYYLGNQNQKGDASNNVHFREQLTSISQQRMNAASAVGVGVGVGIGVNVGAPDIMPPLPPAPGSGPVPGPNGNNNANPLNSNIANVRNGDYYKHLQTYSYPPLSSTVETPRQGILYEQRKNQESLSKMVVGGGGGGGGTLPSSPAMKNPYNVPYNSPAHFGGNVNVNLSVTPPPRPRTTHYPTQHQHQQNQAQVQSQINHICTNHGNGNGEGITNMANLMDKLNSSTCSLTSDILMQHQKNHQNHNQEQNQSQNVNHIQHPSLGLTTAGVGYSADRHERRAYSIVSSPSPNSNNNNSNSNNNSGRQEASHGQGQGQGQQNGKASASTATSTAAATSIHPQLYPQELVPIRTNKLRQILNNNSLGNNSNGIGMAGVGLGGQSQITKSSNIANANMTMTPSNPRGNNPSLLRTTTAGAGIGSGSGLTGLSSLTFSDSARDDSQSHHSHPSSPHNKNTLWSPPPLASQTGSYPNDPNRLRQSVHLSNNKLFRPNAHSWPTRGTNTSTTLLSPTSQSQIGKGSNNTTLIRKSKVTAAQALSLQPRHNQSQDDIEPVQCTQMFFNNATFPQTSLNHNSKVLGTNSGQGGGGGGGANSMSSLVPSGGGDNRQSNSQGINFLRGVGNVALLRAGRTNKPTLSTATATAIPTNQVITENSRETPNLLIKGIPIGQGQ